MLRRLPRRLSGTGLLVSALALLVVPAASTRAGTEELDSNEPSVCAPPCPEGHTCVGRSCVAPGSRAPAPPRPAPPPPSAAPTGGSPPGPPAPRPSYPPPLQPGSAPPPPQPGTAPPPPGTAPPPPGAAAPQQPGYYYPPQQPGYYYPPQQPGYYYPPQQPGYYYPPPAAYAPLRPPRPPRLKSRFLAMPYLGVHSYRNSEANSVGPGARFGVVLGGRLNDVSSLNAELKFDVTNPNNVPAGSEVDEISLAFSFSPLFQIPAGGVEVVLGPKLGMFIINNETRSRTVTAETVTAEAEATGLTVGANAGLFVPVTPATSLGVMLSFEIQEATKVCVRVSGEEFCDSDIDAPTVSVAGASAAALF